MGRLIGSPQGTSPEHIAVLGQWAFEDFGNVDFAELDFHNTSDKYYIYMPKYYFCRMLVQHLLTGALLAFCSYKWFIISAVPFYFIYWFKLMQFYKWCPIVNISEKKIRIFFIAALIVFNIVSIFIRGPVIGAFVWLVDKIQISRLSGYTG